MLSTILLLVSLVPVGASHEASVDEYLWLIPSISTLDNEEEIITTPGTGDGSGGGGGSGGDGDSGDGSGSGSDDYATADAAAGWQAHNPWGLGDFTASSTHSVPASGTYAYEHSWPGRSGTGTGPFLKKTQFSWEGSLAIDDCVSVQSKTWSDAGAQGQDSVSLCHHA